MNAVRNIACPNCGGALEVRAAGFSVNLACAYCGSLLDVSRPEVVLIEAHDKAAKGFRLAPGARGTLFDVEWETVGALRRRDLGYSWEEYLLFNPYAGYRWLVLSDREWQFGTMLLDLPEGNDDTVSWRGERFTRDGDASTSETTAVLGEFYWRVRAGDTVEAMLYERGDTVLSREGGGGEVNWTQLVPVEDDVIAQAFGLGRLKAHRAVREPSPSSGSSSSTANDLPTMFGLACAAIVALLLAMVLISGPVERASASIDAPFAATREGVRIGTLTVRRPWQFVTVTARGTDFDNRWVDLDYSLVDRATGQSMDGYGIVEHYSGRDSDGSWTEGSRKGTTLLGRVPRGTYDLYVDASAHGWPSDPSPQISGWSSLPETVTVSIEAETGSLPWGNWWTAAVLLFAFPCIAVWRQYREENGR
ncbi:MULTISPECIES: DUF4178 domain-containing protein [Novosphingobium]|uniref:DUF4178 domain-containing protein n=1 Tax=Novosphingobium TaxID=165696 RepID=UPI0022F25B28|nr:DUF4178 domain-containing protein [Novosphingobium resinovorum]GLK44572.1 hypothetical protein GCM10017612_24920 [Novosphingobium resinovorum]